MDLPADFASAIGAALAALAGAVAVRIKRHSPPAQLPSHAPPPLDEATLARIVRAQLSQHLDSTIGMLNRSHEKLDDLGTLAVLP